MSLDSVFVSSLTNFQTYFPEASNSRVGWLEKSNRIWRTTRNVVEFFERDTGFSLYNWEYKPSKSATIRDVCECETTRGEIYYLLTIQLASSNLVCLLEFNRLVKVIEVPFSITSLCFFNHSTTLPYSVLSAFHGVVMLGCHGGQVIAMDMQLDVNMSRSVNDHTGLVPAPVRELNPRDSPKVARQQLIRDGVHLLINLNRHSVKQSGQFVYTAPDGAEYGYFASDSVKVTAVAYLAQTISLAVGYSFGCFQLFNLESLALMFSTSINPANPLPPVTHIVLQEPENDPRKYLFLWVGYSSAADTELSPVYGSRMTMYQLAFELDPTSHCGVLIGCACKLELPLSSNPYVPSKKLSVGSSLISCSIAPGLFSRDPAATGGDLTVLIFVWKSQSAEKRAGYHVGVFDLNRWYHAQMPRSVRWERTSVTAVSMTEEHRAPKVCSFMAFHSLAMAVEEAGDPLLRAVVKRASRFYSPPPMCEAQLWPSSLSFDITCIYSTGLQQCKFLGLQELALRRLVTLGSDALDDPGELYAQCVDVSLLPQPVNDSLSSALEPSDIEFQRRSLLGLALERDLFSVLYACARSWTTGVLAAEGCTLTALLDWAWLKLEQLKQEKDQLCQPLFDGTRIGDCLMEQLLRTHRSLTHLTHLFHVLLETTSIPSEQGYADLVTKCHGCSVHKNMLEVILWCIKNKVLPQSVDEGTHCLHYPLDKLRRLYNQLRQPKEPMASNRRLLVDMLHDQIGCGEFMMDNRDGSFYPPDSLEQLINVYATQNTNIQHCIMMYYLTDLNTTASGDVSLQLPSHLAISYAKEFSIPLQLCNCAEGLWHLDHGGVEEAHKRLMHYQPNEAVDNVMFLLYIPIIEGYMENGGVQHAARFADLFGSCDPSGDDREKVVLYIDLLVAVGRLSDALAVTRRNRDSEEEMFNCFLAKCQQAKKLSMIVAQSLTGAEDAALCSYLEDNASLACQELLVMFHLQRSRYVEAVRVNRQLNERQRTLHDVQVWERTDKRNAIVNGVIRSQPSCIQSLAQSHPTSLQHSTQQLQGKPQPMSTVVARVGNSKVLSQAHYVSIVMQKTSETRSSQQQLKQSATPLPATPKPAALMAVSVCEPFVLSPLLSLQRNSSRISTSATPATFVLSARKTPRSKLTRLNESSVASADQTTSAATLSTTSLMERVNQLKQQRCVELPGSLKTPTMKRSPVIDTSLQPPSSLRLPPSILKQHRKAPLTGDLATGQHGVTDSTDFSISQPSARKIRFAAPMYSKTPASSVVKSTSKVSPVVISDSESEEYFSPTNEDSQQLRLDATSNTKRFTSNFTVDGEEMIDLTVDSSNPSSGVQTPEQSPRINLLHFLSTEVSPKDLARSLKKHASPWPSSSLATSVAEPTSAESPKTDVVSRYGVTARSPVSSAEAASVRQISPPQGPDELKRAALLPLEKRLATPITANLPMSPLISARVSIKKLNSPTSALTDSIAKGTVSLRKQKPLMNASVNVSSTTSLGSKLGQPYKFSPPVEVLSPEETNGDQGIGKGSAQSSPNMFFPFSPPLTRSQRKKSEQSDLSSTRVQLFSEQIAELSTDVMVNMDDTATGNTAAVLSETKESGKKKSRMSTSDISTTAKMYHTRSRARSTPRVGSNYDTVLLHPMPTPGSTPSKEYVSTRRTRQKVKPGHKPPLNLRRSSRLLDSTHTDNRMY